MKVSHVGAVLGLIVAAAGPAWAAPMTDEGAAARTLLTHENRMPDRHELEVTLLGSYHEYADDLQDNQDNSPRISGADLNLRFGVNRDFALTASLPGRMTEVGDGDSKVGMGDIRAGFELRALEEPYGYPYVIPYAQVGIPTGDEDKYMGQGDLFGVFGVTIGTVIKDNLDVAVDVGVLASSGNSYGILGAHAIYTFTPKFSVLAEVSHETDPIRDNRNQTFVLGGMSYRPADLWQVSIYGGSSIGGDDSDVLLGLKISYVFDNL